ncbi:LppM family (lipo)protein [Nocardioides sp. AE5]|uniref:LppM family (lipo)protein n=1 Tax=Nocardioides sp. AE5 TaxID=2962573 RepID=UPI0028827C66|nr:hypothetical protein [Nocardioides sp. AE5]MDT0203817.1 hypothetical protein [Nocardioides sp. AE5]
MLRRTLSAIVALGLMILVLSGCFKADYQLSISPDDKVSGTMIVAMNKEAIQAMASFESQGEAPEDLDPRAAWDALMADEDGTEDDLPPGATKEPYEEGDFLGDKITFADVPLAEFSAYMSEDSDDEFSLERVDDTYVFRGSADMSDVTGEDEAAEDELFGEAEMQQFYAMYGTPTFKIAITFPGTVIEHNGELDGTTVTWTADMTSSEVNEFSAVAQASGGSSGSGDGASGGGATDGATDGAAGDGATEGGTGDADEDSEASGDSDDGGFPVLAVVIGLGVLVVALIGAIVTLLMRAKRKG